MIALAYPKTSWRKREAAEHAAAAGLKGNLDATARHWRVTVANPAPGTALASRETVAADGRPLVVVEVANPQDELLDVLSRLRMAPSCELEDPADDPLPNPGTRGEEAPPDPEDNSVPIVVSVSGGKDSTAMSSYVVRNYGRYRNLTNQGFPRIIFVWADTGLEWEDAEDQARKVVDRLVALYPSLAGEDGTFPFYAVQKRNAAGMLTTLLEQIEARGITPDDGNRWCTSEFKTAQVNALIKRLWPVQPHRATTEEQKRAYGIIEAGPPLKILVAIGIRAQESWARAVNRFGSEGASKSAAKGGKPKKEKRRAWTDPDEFMSFNESASARPVGKARAAGGARLVWNWYPIYEWGPGFDGFTHDPEVSFCMGKDKGWVERRLTPSEDVWAEAKAYGLPEHWAYSAGFKRMSCSFCIYGSPADLRRAAELRPDLFQRIGEVERKLEKRLAESAKLPPAEQIVCPKCEAPPCEPCVTASGRESVHTHKERKRGDEARKQLAAASVHPQRAGVGTPVPRGASLVSGIWLDEIFKELPTVTAGGFTQETGGQLVMFNPRGSVPESWPDDQGLRARIARGEKPIVGECGQCGYVREFDKHPLRLVKCPSCRAGVGAPCKRPSGHTQWGGAEHVKREQLIVDSGLFPPCPDCGAGGAGWRDELEPEPEPEPPPPPPPPPEDDAQMRLFNPAAHAVAFPKAHWSRAEASATAREHGLRPIATDETDNYWRVVLRQGGAADYGTESVSLAGRPVSVVVGNPTQVEQILGEAGGGWHDAGPVTGTGTDPRSGFAVGSAAYTGELAKLTGRHFKRAFGASGIRQGYKGTGSRASNRLQHVSIFPSGDSGWPAEGALSMYYDDDAAAIGGTYGGHTGLAIPYEGRSAADVADEIRQFVTVLRDDGLDKAREFRGWWRERPDKSQPLITGREEPAAIAARPPPAPRPRAGKFRYGALLRPISSATLPPGTGEYEIETHADFKHGVVVLDKPLDPAAAEHMSLVRFVTESEALDSVTEDYKEYAAAHVEEYEDDPSMFAIGVGRGYDELKIHVEGFDRAAFTAKVVDKLRAETSQVATGDPEATQESRFDALRAESELGPGRSDGTSARRKEIIAWHHDLHVRMADLLGETQSSFFGLSPQLQRKVTALTERKNEHAAERDRLDELERSPLGMAVARSEQRRAQTPARRSEATDLWTPAARTKANLAAMHIAASKTTAEMTEEDREALALYSGWGGLSIRKAAGGFPDDFPRPHARGLIHEYYTPTAVVDEVARMVQPLMGTLPRQEGKVLALEPSAGIGRFIQAASGPGFDDLDWTAVEWSELSSSMLGALRPDVELTVGPFEAWVRDEGHRYAGRFGLLLGNPPYGKRGSALTEDPDRSYRERAAYAYFLRRGLDLLAPGGLGVYLVPGGFLTGKGAQVKKLREKVLRRHHLASAYRLPSGIFPGANLVIDLLVFRARGGELEAVAPDDEAILAGDYFRLHPDHILGTEVGGDGVSEAGEDVTKKARYGYQVEGEFTTLPPLVERPLYQGHLTALPPVNPPKRRRAAKARAPGDMLAAALWLGGRVATYRESDAEKRAQLHDDLTDALSAWVNVYGNPSSESIRSSLLAASQDDALGSFLSAFTPEGGLVEALQHKPEIEVALPRRGGDLALADALYRAHHVLPVDTLTRASGGFVDLGPLFAAGWSLDGSNLAPAMDYLSGELWPKYDRAQEVIDRGADPLGGAVPLDQIRRQLDNLAEAIAPLTFEEIEGITPQQGWIPIDIIAAWANKDLRSEWYKPVELVREDGIVQVAHKDYEHLGSETRDVQAEVRHCIGWMNHDRTVFRPSYRKSVETLDEARVKKAKAWIASFLAFVGAEEDTRSRMEDAYNRRFRGYVQPEYGDEAVDVARWGDVIKPYPHQVGGARRLMANRGGLLAYGTGVGKTFSAILMIANARQEGWCRRPVVLVPNSIIWKWHADIAISCPDFRIAVIGSKLVEKRGGGVTSKLDTPGERATKWADFQAGLYDCVLLTYSALARTDLDEGEVVEYAEHTVAIQREVRLRQRNARSGKGELSERQEAVLEEGVAGWVAEKLELPETWEKDPGIVWNDIGIDLLIVDEAQNFKNLYLPEAREGGVPRFMGSSGPGAKRAWQLDFRSAAVRKRSGGSGVVLLSATPAKNSPLEFYNIIQYVDHDVWTRMGISDPEQFIDRYLTIELRQVLNTTMMPVERSAVTGFDNLHELRAVLFRYGDFKTSEDVGLKLPETKVAVVEVDMNDEQVDKNDYYVEQIEEALESTSYEEKGKILGLLARMAMVAIHPRLDEKYNYKTAADVTFDRSSPKFEALASAVLRQKDCGHIVFVENLAAHRWAKDTLVARGVPEGRIATLNATTAKNTLDRKRISDEFNGDAKEGVAPLYDVVIANQIAYEGIDLQRRTCAIHHLDLPWEPATLEQRNGRGVRQGNTEPVIEINYYFASRSQDGLRFNLITGKRNWMAQLLRSQDRSTNNPAAQLQMGPDEILLLISRDPVETQKRLDAIRVKREETQRERVRSDAARTLSAAAARFRKAETTADNRTASRLRAEAEERLQDLRALDPQAWPWAYQIDRVRTEPVIVTPDGVPLFVGTRLRVGSQLLEVGQIRGREVGLRDANRANWTATEIGKVAPFAKPTEDGPGFQLTPDDVDPADWPPDDLAHSRKDIGELLPRSYGFRGWSDSGLPWASDAWLEAVWPEIDGEVADAIRTRLDRGSWRDAEPVLPARGSEGGVIGLTEGHQVGGSRKALFPPTTEGWYAFLASATEPPLRRFGELEAMGRYWWHRVIPRDLLSAPRDRRPRFTTAPDAPAPPEAVAPIMVAATPPPLPAEAIVEPGGQFRLFNPKSGLDPLVAKHIFDGDVTRSAMEVVFYPPAGYESAPGVVGAQRARGVGPGGRVLGVEEGRRDEPLTGAERKLLRRLPEVLDLGWFGPVDQGDDYPTSMANWPTRLAGLTSVLLDSPSLRYLDHAPLYSLIAKGHLRVVSMPSHDVPPPPPRLVRRAELSTGPGGETYTLAKIASEVDVARLSSKPRDRMGQEVGRSLFGDDEPAEEVQIDLFANPVARPKDPVDVTFPAAHWTEAEARRWLRARGMPENLEPWPPWASVSLQRGVEGADPQVLPAHAGWKVNLRPPSPRERSWYGTGESKGKPLLWHGEGKAPELRNPSQAAVSIEPRPDERGREQWFDVTVDGGRVNAVLDPDFSPRSYGGEGDAYGGHTYGFLTNLWVDPPRRRQGIASTLVRAGVRHMHGLGVRRVIVFPEGQDSDRLVAKLGFVQNYMRVRSGHPPLRGWELDLRQPPPWLAEAERNPAANPKRIHGKVYVHRSALRDLSPTEQKAVSAARRHLPRAAGRAWDVCKVNPSTGGVTFSAVPTFAQEETPAIAEQWLVRADGSVRHMPAPSPPHILHRTELMLPNPAGGGDNQGRTAGGLRGFAERGRRDAERRERHYERGSTPGTPEHARLAAIEAAEPQWEPFEGVEILRSPGRPVAAIPASDRRDSRQFVVFDLETREEIAYLRKREVVPWLVKEALRSD